MTRNVIGPDVPIRLARDRIEVSDEHQLLAPALLRSQVVALLYGAVQRGELTNKDAQQQPGHVEGHDARGAACCRFLAGALGRYGGRAHAVRMTRQPKYAMSLDELVASANVPLDEQVEEQDASELPEHDESAGHLPGNVRPYGA